MTALRIKPNRRVSKLIEIKNRFAKKGLSYENHLQKNRCPLSKSIEQFRISTRPVASRGKGPTRPSEKAHPKKLYVTPHKQ